MQKMTRKVVLGVIFRLYDTYLIVVIVVYAGAEVGSRGEVPPL